MSDSRVASCLTVSDTLVTLWRLYRNRPASGGNTSHLCRLRTRCRARPVPVLKDVLLANMARIKQSRPDYGLGFKVKVVGTIQVVPYSLASGPTFLPRPSIPRRFSKTSVYPQRADSSVLYTLAFADETRLRGHGPRSGTPNTENRQPKRETWIPKTETRILKPETRKPKTGNREPKPESRKPKIESLNLQP